jgi:hypothetical protein
MKESQLYNAAENDKSEFKKVEMLTSDEIRDCSDLQLDKFQFCNFFKLLLPYFLGTLALCLYLITLKGCSKTQFECLQIFTNDVVKKMLVLLFLSALCFNLQILLFLKNRESKLPFIIMCSAFFFVCFIYDTGADFDSHGGYNRLLLLLFSLVWGILFLLGKIIYSLFKKSPLITTVSLIAIIFFINGLKVKIVNSSCDTWDKGLRGVSIDNTGDTLCKIRAPKICYFEIFNGSMDITRLLRENCETMSTNKLSNNIEHMEDKNARYIGYPRSEYFSHFPESQQNIYQKTVMKKLVNMEDPKISQKVKAKIEVTTDYRQNPPQVKIDLKRDESLARTRNYKYEKNKANILTKNVIHIFVDSVSRPNFKRKMPQLHKWLEAKYLLPGESYNDKKSESFQFMKYHGLGTFTGINMVPAVFGVYNSYMNGRHYITDFKKKGFVTGQATGFCSREIFDMDPGAIKGLAWDNFDHELSSLFCDGNFTPYNDMYALLVGVNTPRIRCLYNRSVSSYSLEYATQFFQKYPNEAKFFRMMFYDAHEGTQEVIKYTDTEITDFLRNFEKLGYLDDTTLVIQTDHGLGMPGVYSGLDLEDYHKETVLPSLFMVIPTHVKNYDTIRKNLKYNEQSMGTHFTLFNTFHAFLNGSRYYSYNDEYDFINDKIPRSRNCRELKNQDYWNWFTLHCRCEEN